MDVSGGLSLVQTILQVLGSPIWTEFETVLGLKSQLEKLKLTMSTIQNVLLDAEEQERRHHTCPTHVERGRLERLKEALYQADDLFDEVATLAHRKKLMSGSRFFSCLIQLRSAFTWSGEIKKIREMLGDIVNDHQHDFGLMRHSVDLRVTHNPRETHSFLCEEDEIIGRDKDKQIVIDILLDTTVEESVSVVSIVGIGGLGKTTLARQVYNDEVILKEFPLKMWVCISDNFDVKALVGQILAAADPEIKPGGLSVDNLQKKLRQQLDGNRYLLVLDDVWNEDPSKWLELRTLLTGGGRASKIVVTTRSRKVADVVGGSHCLHWTHELMGLSDEDSWKLFQKMALKPGQHPLKPHLNEVGKEIVRKCANVPLAIRVVGSLLRGQGESKWKSLKNTDLANIVQDEINGIVPVLKISYNYLPFHLKSCFSYCAVFPKDYKIIKEDLIGLWIAQGFIMPSDRENFEDAGEEYFEQLLQRCFFQDVELAKGTDEIISFKMHDLIHDLAKEVAGTEILLCNYSTQCFNKKTRHVYIDESTPEDLVGNLSKMKRMRTFLCDDPPFPFKSLVVEVLKMKCLRVLQLNRTCDQMKTLPSVIGDFLHLRYLDLSDNSWLYVLPSSITKLYNLQILKLRSCKSLIRLPRELSKLVNLRHLDISDCSSLTHMPPGINTMKSLQKLTMFVVSGSGSGRSNADWNWRSADVGQLEDLDNFTNYTRTMQIIVKKGARYNAVGGEMLLNCRKLWEIKYNFGETEENYNAEGLLQGLQPHSNLRKLELFDYPGVRFPTWMTISCCLPNLVQIEITGCKRLEQLPLMSQLRHLKVLILDQLNEVEYVESSSNNSGADDDELVFFPSLEKLQLIKMPKLKGWWKSESGKSEIPKAAKLSYVDIQFCPNLITFPFCPELKGSSMNLSTCLPNLVKIEINDCSRLEHLPLMSQLHHLKVLELQGLHEVKYVESRSNIISGDDDDYYYDDDDDDEGGELVFFPSLEKLKLDNMPKLKGWWKSESESGKGEKPQAPMLSHLGINCCPKLTTFPLCPGLQQLDLQHFNEALGPVMQQDDEARPGRLREVTMIDNVGYLNSLPIQSFHHLSHLQIRNDQKMERLNIGEVGEVFQSGCLSALRSLEINCCYNLKSISGRGVWDYFTSLENLKLYDLSKLELEGENDVISNTEEGCIINNNDEGSDEELPWRYLAPTLHSLRLTLLPKVVKLPKGIGCLSSLHSLYIWGCENLESLAPSIGSLSSLQSLDILGCRKLKRMPEEMRHLTSLTKLRIWKCSPELMKECKNKNGANWSNIQHIPNIIQKEYY